MNVRHGLQAVLCSKRIKLICVFFVIAASLGVSSSDALPNTVVRVEPSASSVAVGGVFSMNVMVADVENLYGLEIILTWNSSVLRLINVELWLGQYGGVLNNPIYIVENSSQQNKYALSATSVPSASPFNGTGNIVCMNFSVASVGTCTLDLQTQLYDYPPLDRDPRLSFPIPHTDIDGSFNAPISELSTLGQVLALAALICVTAFSISNKKKRSNTNVPAHRRYTRQNLLRCQKAT